MQHVQDTQNMLDMEPVQDAQDIHDMEPLQDARDMQDMQHVQDAQGVQDMQHTGHPRSNPTCAKEPANGGLPGAGSAESGDPNLTTRSLRSLQGPEGIFESRCMYVLQLGDNYSLSLARLCILVFPPFASVSLHLARGICGRSA